MAQGQAGQEGGQSQGGVRGVWALGISGRSRKALSRSDPQCSEAQEEATGGPIQGGIPPRWSHSQLSRLLASTRTFPFPSDLSLVCPGRSGAGAGGCSYEESPRWGKRAPGLSLETLVGAGAPKALPRGFPHSLRWEFLAVHCTDEETEARPSAEAELVCQTPSPPCVASRVVITKGGSSVCVGKPRTRPFTQNVPGALVSQAPCGRWT